MSAVKPQVGTLIFDEGAGTPQALCNGVIAVGNPGGGEPGAVIVPGRAKPFGATLRGAFATMPDVRALQGSTVNYTKDGSTVSVFVQEAEIVGKSEVYDGASQLYMITARFVFMPTT